MKFYRINNSVNTKLMGTLPQIKNYKYHGDIHNPKFIGKIHYQKVDFEPVPVNPILSNKANKTDLIESGGQLSLKILVSTKLKNYLHKNDFGVQYFQNSIIHKEIEDKEYYVVSPYNSKNEWIDFENTLIYYRKYNPDKIEDFQILKLNNTEFNLLLNNKNIFDEIYFYKFSILREKADKDFFVVNKSWGGISFIVSEKLKKEIEDAGCSGIEFQPSELSYNEWLAPGGERERVYGKSW